MLSWHRSFIQYQKDLKLFIFCFLFFQIYRALFIFLFVDQMNDESSIYDLLHTIMMGAKYDIQVAAIWAMVPFLFLSVPSKFININRLSNKLRIWWGALFTITSIIICVSSIEFYREYRDPFNQFLFGIVYDDTTAIITTIIAEYNFGANLFIISVITFLYIRFAKTWLTKEFFTLRKIRNFLHKSKVKKALTIAGLLTLIILIVSSFTYRERIEDEIDKMENKIDIFLEKAVIPPFSAFYEATTEFLHLMSQNGLNYFIGNNLQEELKFFTQQENNFNTIDEYLIRETKGPLLKNKPKHVFLIVMESYDSWPMQPEYAKLNISNNLKQLGKDGFYFNNFLPSSNSTMATLSSIISGLPDVEVRTNYQTTSKQPYSTSIAHIMSKLGYQTQFFINGYSTWHRVKAFTTEQGFKNFYSIENYQTFKAKNEWSIDDESFFTFVYNTVKNNKKPTFNMLMSGSNHTPYDLDLDQEGFDASDIEKNFTLSYYASASIRTMGHYWYSDRELGKFVDKMSNLFPDCLFIITGDHYSRHHIKNRPNLFERSAVPLVIYSKQDLKAQLQIENTNELAGCHLDMLPTIVELIAPKGFKYHTMGNSLFNPYREYIGFGNNRAITKDFIVSTNRFNKIYMAVNPNEDLNQPQEKQLLKDLKRFNKAAHAIGWWRIMKGNELQEKLNEEK